MDLNTFYVLTNDIEEKSLVLYFHNPDAGCNGFGFNIADGCGFVPETDIPEYCTLEPVMLVSKETNAEVFVYDSDDTAGSEDPTGVDDPTYPEDPTGVDPTGV